MTDDLKHAYAPDGEERPLAGYAILTGVFDALFAGSLLALARTGRELPERYGLSDVLLVGAATHKLSRLVGKDKVTSFVRAPFTEYQGSAGPGEIEEKPRGHGLRYAIGELLVCPYCLGLWVSAAFSIGLVAAPRGTRFMAFIFTTLGISDALQIAYKAAEDRDI